MGTGAGDDVILGGPGFEFIGGDSEGVAGAHGSGGDDYIDMGTGDGIVLGDHNINVPAEEGGGPATGAGNDTIIGADDSTFELIVGDSSVGDDSITAAGNDHIVGNGGDDFIFGDNVDFTASFTVGTASGNDRLEGGGGDDFISAGPGNDQLDGGADADFCDGEAGNDNFKACEAVAGSP